MANILIIGASRGIGLELTKQYLAAGDSVIATARAGGADNLESISDAGLTIQTMDISDSASIETAAGEIGEQALDAVIIVAGAVGGGRQSLDDLDLEEWHRTFDTNTIGPALAAKAFKSNLAASGNGHLMILTSQLAASTWPMGGMFIYSTTKAAVSKVGQILALDWKADPITVTLMHPGWVQTDMGGPNAEITAEESAAGIRSVIANATKEDSGKFYKWNGEIHAW